jgi:hypothetical protein
MLPKRGHPLEFDLGDAKITDDFERTLRDCKQLIEAARKSIERTKKMMEERQSAGL